MKKLILLLMVGSLFMGCTYKVQDIHGNLHNQSRFKKIPLWIMNIERDEFNQDLFYITYMVKNTTFSTNEASINLEKKKIFKKEMFSIAEEYGYVAFLVISENHNIGLITDDWIAEVMFFKTIICR